MLWSSLYQLLNSPAAHSLVKAPNTANKADLASELCHCSYAPLSFQTLFPQASAVIFGSEAVAMSWWIFGGLFICQIKISFHAGFRLANGNKQPLIPAQLRISREEKRTLLSWASDPSWCILSASWFLQGRKINKIYKEVFSASMQTLKAEHPPCNARSGFQISSWTEGLFW